MEFILFVLLLGCIALISYGFDYTFELTFFQDIDEIERVLG